MIPWLSSLARDDPRCARTSSRWDFIEKYKSECCIGTPSKWICLSMPSSSASNADTSKGEAHCCNLASMARSRRYIEPNRYCASDLNSFGAKLKSGKAIAPPPPTVQRITSEHGGRPSRASTCPGMAGRFCRNRPHHRPLEIQSVSVGNSPACWKSSRLLCVSFNACAKRLICEGCRSLRTRTEFVVANRTMSLAGIFFS